MNFFKAFLTLIRRPDLYRPIIDIGKISAPITQPIVEKYFLSQKIEPNVITAVTAIQALSNAAKSPEAMQAFVADALTQYAVTHITFKS